MISLILRLIINAVGLWLAVELVDGIDFTDPAGTSDTTRKVISLVVLAAIFTVVNALVKPLVKLLSLPLVILTLGLFALVVNALLFWLTAEVTEALGAPFEVDGFWSAFWGALVVGIVSWLLSVLVRDSDD